MNVPRLNRRVSLEAPVPTPDGAGGFSRTWQPMGTLWAEVRPRSGRERNGEAGVLSVTTFRIIVRAAPVGHSNRPLPGQRFRMQGRTFAIQAVTEMEPEAAYLVCFSEEEVAA